MAVDITKPQAPSLDHQPEIRGAGHGDGPPTTVTHGGSDRATGDSSSSVSGPSSRSTGYATFTKLCREDTDDIADFDDGHATVATGKRVTFADDAEDGSWTSCSRPTRRAVRLIRSVLVVVSACFDRSLFCFVFVSFSSHRSHSRPPSVFRSALPPSRTYVLYVL